MALIIPVAHDFTCPWCWVGLLQARRLKREFDVAFDWRGYELWPEELPRPSPSIPATPNTRRPPVPSRFDLQLAAEGITMPHVERAKLRYIHNALEAVEYAKAVGVGEELVDVLYCARWEQGKDISDVAVLKELAEPLIADLDDFAAAVRERRYQDRIVNFDDDAYADGIYNVPTFLVGGKRLAEQPYVVIREAVAQAIQEENWAGIYAAISFPPPSPDRPYVSINMVATIDGKTVAGDRGDSAVDLGSKVDHRLMRRLEEASDAVLIGAQTLRSTSKDWSPRTDKRIVVTRSGELPGDAAFFTRKAFVAGPQGIRLPEGAGLLQMDGFADLLRQLRAMDIRRLLVLGGSEINAEILRDGLADELFLTIAPKVKLGRDLPTYAGGVPLARDHLLHFCLVEHHAYESEVFLRYRRKEQAGS